MYGTMPKVAPSQACTKKEKTTRQGMADLSLFWREKMTRKMPSSMRQSDCATRRPRMPMTLLRLSERMPPDERACVGCLGARRLRLVQLERSVGVCEVGLLDARRGETRRGSQTPRVANRFIQPKSEATRPASMTPTPKDSRVAK
jgi:hypothetical protein